MTVLKLIVDFRKKILVGMTFFDSNRIITARSWFESLLKPQIRNEIKDFKFFLLDCSMFLDTYALFFRAVLSGRRY